MMLKRLSVFFAVTCGLLLPSLVFGRPWRDQKGNVINAEFVKVDRGMVYLKPENKYAAATPFPFYDFSEADQDFLKALLTKKGQADRIPPPPPKKDDPNGKPNQLGAANTSNVPIAVNSPANAFPSPPRVDPLSIPITSTNPTIPQASPNNPALPITVTPPIQTTPTLAPHFSPQQMGMMPNGIPQQVMVKKCSGCNKEISANATAGQKCPHCGAIWSFEKNQFGMVTNAAPVGFENGPMYSRGMVRLAFLIGAFVIGGIAKIVHDNK